MKNIIKNGSIAGLVMLVSLFIGGAILAIKKFICLCIWIIKDELDY